MNETTIDQKRAAHAAKMIGSIAENNDGMYVSYISAMPATIVMNGLGQALVTKLAKAKKDNCDDSHRLIYNHVADWLCSTVPQLAGEPDKLIQRLMEQDQSVYVHAQAEAMAYLNWLKQFARALLHDKGDETHG